MAWPALLAAAPIAAAAADGSIYDYLDTHYPAPYQRAEKESVTVQELPRQTAVDTIPGKPAPTASQPGAPEPAAPQPATPEPAAPQPKIVTVPAPAASLPRPAYIPQGLDEDEEDEALQARPAASSPAPASPASRPWQVMEPEAAPPPVAPAAAAPLPPPPAAAAAPAVSAGRIIRSQFTTQVSKLEPVDHIREVSAQQGNVRYFSEISGLKGQVLTHRWLKGGTTLLEKRMNIGSDQWRVWSSMRLKPEYAGVVSVITLDGAGAVLHEEQLVVRP